MVLYDNDLIFLVFVVKKIAFIILIRYQYNIVSNNNKKKNISNHQ